jgi:hypothetical protein
MDVYAADIARHFNLRGNTKYLELLSLTKSALKATMSKVSKKIDICNNEKNEN